MEKRSISRKEIAKRASYPSNLTNEHWEIIEPLLPASKSGTPKGGRPRKTNVREVFNAILYITRTGCPWQYLPHDFPKWTNVYDYHDAWTRNGILNHIHDTLAGVRVSVGKEPTATAAIVDSQSIKSAFAFIVFQNALSGSILATEEPERPPLTRRLMAALSAKSQRRLGEDQRFYQISLIKAAITPQSDSARHSLERLDVQRVQQFATHLSWDVRCSQ